MRGSVAFAGLLLLIVPGPLMAASGKTTTNPANKQTSARAGVNALNQKEEAACREMDNAKSGALWADDGVDLIQGLDPMIGKATIVKWYDSLTAQTKGAKMEYCTIDWKEIKIRGNWAWEWAITKQKIDFPGQPKPFESAGKMVYVLKKQADGDWKIELESWNSAPAAEETK